MQWLRCKTCVAVLRTLATHRVTYQFFGLLLVTLGVAQGGPLVEGFWGCRPCFTWWL